MATTVADILAARATKQQAEGIPYTTHEHGVPIDVKQRYDEGFKIEDGHGMPALIIVPELEFEFPEKAVAPLIGCLGGDAAYPASLSKVLKPFLNLQAYSDELLAPLSKLDFKNIGVTGGQVGKEIPTALAALHVVETIVNRDGLGEKYSLQDRVELAQDKDLLQWVVNYFKKAAAIETPRV